MSQKSVAIKNSTDTFNTNDDKCDADLTKLQVFERIGAGLKATRVGKKNDGSTRPVLMLVGLKEKPGSKDVILTKARNLNMVEAPWCDISQRKEEKCLIREAEWKNEAMTNEDSLNFKWAVMMWRGERNLIRRRKLQE